MAALQSKIRGSSVPSSQGTLAPLLSMSNHDANMKERITGTVKSFNNLSNKKELTDYVEKLGHMPHTWPFSGPKNISQREIFNMMPDDGVLIV